MKFQLYIFFSIFLSLFSLLNYYIGSRIKYILMALPFDINIKIYWLVFWIIALSYIVSRVGERMLPEAFTDILTKIGIYWLGAMFYFFMFFFTIDFLNVLNNWVGFVHLSSGQREIMLFKGGILLLTIVTGLLLYGSWNAKQVRIVDYQINIQKPSELNELHAVMVSDIHLGDVINGTNLDKMVSRINELSPDIIFLAGDIIDSRIKPYENSDMPNIFRGLKAPYGVYAVLGNHEYYQENPDDITRHYEDVGIKVLRDEYVKVNESFYVVGRNDVAIKQATGNPREKLSELLEDQDSSLPIILLDHNPKYMNEAEENKVDLQLSGHTHRGQMFPGSIITNSIFEIDWGHLKKGDFNIIVSSGYGTWGPPLRIGTNSEIVNIKIRFNNK